MVPKHTYSNSKSTKAKGHGLPPSKPTDPVDVPQVAETFPSSGSAVTVKPAKKSSRKKRKAGEDARDVSQSTPVRAQSSLSPRTQAELQQENDQPIDEEGEGEIRDEVYCVMNTNVVGIQYYHGLVGPGEEVVLVREPRNPYDSNAIQVKNVGGTQVGHLPRRAASKLAPLLDQRLVTVDGVINDGNLSGHQIYTLSITLRIYGASDMRPVLEPLLLWATPGQRGFSRKPITGNSPHPVAVAPATGTLPIPRLSTQRSGASFRTVAEQEAFKKQQEASQKAAELKQMLSSLEKVDDEDRRDSLLDALCLTDNILNLPLHPNPPSIKNGDLKVDLLKHQSQALQWCVEREYPTLPKKESDKPVQFWQFRKNGNTSYYFNLATKTPQQAAPLLGRGALCADAMGLGKTLIMLALILTTKSDIPRDFSNTTLVVAPLSVLSNWEKQVYDHCTDGSLSVCVYHGSSRSMSPEQLTNFDVVITTYQTIAGEHCDSTGEGRAKKKKKIEQTLFAVQWKRIILDEGHTIRNSNTKMTKGVCGLSSERRWVLTGTPIINSPRDLGSILKFLRICQPLDNEDFYKRLLLRPLKDGIPSGAELLRALMSHICIRRTKEMQDIHGNSLIPLPPVEMVLVPVTLSNEARSLYDEVERLSKERLENFMNRNDNSMVQMNMLSMLTRMRQLALHPGLVPTNYLQELRDTNAGVEVTHTVPINLAPQEKPRLQGLLARAVEEFEECPICFAVLNEPRITYCGHCFCLLCITEVISRDAKCPMDRRPLGMGDLLEPPPPTDLTQVPIIKEEELDATGIRGGSSAKIGQLVRLLQLTPSTEKSLVFSQFTSFLDKIGEALEAESIPYVRFDGQMSAKRRQETIAQFSTPLEDHADVETRLKSLTRANASDDEYIDDIDDSDAYFLSNDKNKGKSKRTVRSKRLRTVLSNENPKVMLLSLKAGAVGLNLTVANNVYLMDPWWQEGIESQAIDRVNRIGQKKPVHVYQLITENTVESKVLEIQERKKKLIQHAFSGIKRTETQHQRREARLQELIELFGVRQQSDH